MHRIEIEDPSVVVLVGAAGAGKSTFAARHFRMDEILASDTFRAVVAGDPADQRATGPAFRRLHQELARRLARGRLSVVDATNLTADARRAVLGHAAYARVPATAIVLAPPAEAVRAQNAGRPGRVVPPDVVDRHLRALDELLASGRLEAEGFAAVHRLDDATEIDRVLIVRLTARAIPDDPRD